MFYLCNQKGCNVIYLLLVKKTPQNLHSAEADEAEQVKNLILSHLALHLSFRTGFWQTGYHTIHYLFY